MFPLIPLLIKEAIMFNYSRFLGFETFPLIPLLIKEAISGVGT